MNGVWDDDSLIYRLPNRTCHSKKEPENKWFSCTHIALFLGGAGRSTNRQVAHVVNQLIRNGSRPPRLGFFVIASRENDRLENDGIELQIIGTGSTAEEARDAAVVTMTAKVISGAWFLRPDAEGEL